MAAHWAVRRQEAEDGNSDWGSYGNSAGRLTGEEVPVAVGFGPALLVAGHGRHLLGGGAAHSLTLSPPPRASHCHLREREREGQERKQEYGHTQTQEYNHTQERSTVRHRKESMVTHRNKLYGHTQKQEHNCIQKQGYSHTQKQEYSRTQE